MKKIKTAKEYLKDFVRPFDGQIELHSGDSENILNILLQAQLDMLEYAVNKCADNADTEYSKPNDGDRSYLTGIDKQSILKTIDEIKEELK